ncbi:MAG: hypothetical protein IMY67_03200, partial [Bacteroidetes bacterium]|nr:hypothetical protein [Bacteroidota bacterium]
GWVVVDFIIFDISKTTDIENAIRMFRRKYQIPKNRCIGDADGVGCLENNMEVLTEKGWKKAIDITKIDSIVSKDEFGYKEYVKPFEIIHHEREKFTRINDDLAFTNTHIHFYKTRPEHKVKSKYWDDITEFKAFSCDQEVTPKENEKEYVSFIETKGYKNQIYVELELFCRFLGWILSDGHIDNYNNKNIIAISQSTKSPHNEEIEYILNKLGVNWRKDVQKEALNRYSFQHKSLFEWIKYNCYNGEKQNFETKTLPQVIKDANKDCFMAFCETFINGDGYYHKDKMQFVGTNKTLLDEIQVGLFMNGINSRFYISHKKGSIGVIDGRSFKRKKDCYLLSEVSHPPRYIIKKTETFFDKAVNIRIPNKTRAMLVRNGKNVFWTHNGGVIDGTGIIGFVNISTPIKEKGDMPKYKNLQVQCLYHLADKVNEGGLWIKADFSSKVKEYIKEELDQIQSRNTDERKLDCKRKSDIKEDIGRSPDYRDALLMRVYFDLKQVKRRFVGTRQRRTI